MGIFTSPKVLQEYVSGFGFWAPAVFFLLQVAVVFLAFVPRNMTTLAGGALFGFAQGFFLSAAAMVCGAALAFLLARKLGPKAVRKIAGAKLFDKYEHLINSSTAAARIRVTLVVTMLLPFFPDDLICFLAGLSAVRLRTFLLIITLCRPWGLLVSALAGSGALDLPLWVMITVGACSLAAGIAAVRFAPQLEAWAMRVLKRATDKAEETE
jgi:uncharacterized membrane protein YdjX (TVP38/TMEM64 family)